jgi:RNA polymerase sigma-70 factor (ECF subfamily)
VAKEKRIYLDEDTKLTIRVSEGDDRDAYAEIHIRYFFAVANFISSLDDQLRASEDITQDVFTEFWENRRKYRPTSTLKTFLFGYAKNAFYRYRTKKNKENTLFVSPSNVVLDEIEATDACNENDINKSPRLSEELISQLPGKQKCVFEMMYLSGVTPKETAKQLGCSVHSVHQNLHLARKTIRKLLVKQVPSTNEKEQKNKKIQTIST